MADLKCPNCSGPVVAGKEGEMVCTSAACGGRFVWKDGDRKLAGVGDFDKLRGDVDQLRSDFASLKGAQPADPEKPAKPAETADDEDDL